MTVEDILLEWLKDHEFAGLENEEGCACHVTALMTCDCDCDVAKCEPWKDK
jgi:hypothetical protein